jgi:hypothetical protein
MNGLKIALIASAAITALLFFFKLVPNSGIGCTPVVLGVIVVCILLIVYGLKNKGRAAN